MLKFNRPASVPDGIHEAKLKSVEDGKRKAFESEEMEDCITFTFTLPNEEGEELELKRDVTPSIGAKSNLVKMLKAMAGSQATQDVFRSDSKLNALIQSLIGKDFLIQTELRGESGFCKIINVMATGKKGSYSTAKAAIAKKETVTEEDNVSDIPF